MKFDKFAFDIEEACQVAAHHRTKLYQAIKDRKLKARKVGTRTIILADDLNDYLQNLPLAKGE